LIAGKYLSITVINLAKNGRSTRSFINEGLWKSLLAQTQPGDFVLIEMGHNDAGDPTKGDKYTDRGTLRGTDSKSVSVQTSKGKEEVHTFGYYLKNMVKDVQAKQAIPILSGMVPTNSWEGNQMRPAEKFVFAEYSKEVAKTTHVEYLDHTKYSVKRFTALGSTKTKTMFPNDSTHTNAEGARRKIFQSFRKKKLLT
jgi:rhamnogalacturonan acetylesterase